VGPRVGPCWTHLTWQACIRPCFCRSGRTVGTRTPATTPRRSWGHLRQAGQRH